MKDKFVTPEIASDLKKLGYDEPCFGYYTSNDKFSMFVDVENCNTNNEFGFYPTAPLWQDVVDWLREFHFLWIETPMYIIQQGRLNGCYAYKAIIKSDENYKEKIDFEKEEINSLSRARETAVTEAIKILKRRKNLNI